jgi:NitT/TauT family transport system permease protein
LNPYLLGSLAVLATTARILGLIGLSVLSGWFLGYIAVMNRRFESVYVALTEVLESVPVISFFPIVLIFFVSGIGGPLGVELAADFLVFTAVVWNIWIGIYQAFKTLPKEMHEVSENYSLGFWQRMNSLYVPFSVPRIAANLFPSFADGFFYIVVSEVFSVGASTYSTFGVGSFLDMEAGAGDLATVAFTMVFTAAVVVAVTLGLREFGKLAVSKYTLDTDTPIMRRGRIRLRYSAVLSHVISKNTLQRLSLYNRRGMARRFSALVEQPPKARGANRYIGWAVLALFLVLLMYGVVETLAKVPVALWGKLVGLTPEVLVNLGFDYLRVGIITAVSLAIAVSLGYYLAVNKRVERILIPLLQIVSSYPAPVYFPLLFLIMLPFVHGALGPLTTEFFVLLLGFVSTFYYVFFSFWMGVKSLPVEYWELMKNLRMGFLQKMRSIILPASLPYLIAGISSTVNSAWGGLMIAEYWPNIVKGTTLEVHHGLMKFIAANTATGNIGYAAWGSLLFGMVVVLYSYFFTKRMMDLARKRYIPEEGVYAA